MNKKIIVELTTFCGRYKLHQYLKYARQWVISFTYKGRYYTILDNGKVVIIY